MTQTNKEKEKLKIVNIIKQKSSQKFFDVNYLASIWLG